METTHSFRPRLQATVAALIACALWLWLRGMFSMVVLAVTATLALLAWLVPSVYAPVHRGLERLAQGTAMAVSWFLLALVFFGMFVPLRLWRAAKGKNPLELGWDARASTYLRPIPPPRPDHFERMY